MKRKMEESMSWLIRFTLVAAFIVLLAPQRTMAKGCSAHIECSVGGPASWDVIGELHVDGSCSARFPDLKCLHSCKPNVHQMKDAVKLCRERYQCADGVCVKEYDKVLGWLWWRAVSDGETYGNNQKKLCYLWKDDAGKWVPHLCFD